MLEVPAMAAPAHDNAIVAFVTLSGAIDSANATLTRLLIPISVAPDSGHTTPAAGVDFGAGSLLPSGGGGLRSSGISGVGESEADGSTGALEAGGGSVAVLGASLAFSSFETNEVSSLALSLPEPPHAAKSDEKSATATLRPLRAA
jgi:hypothetical protein